MNERKRPAISIATPPAAKKRCSTPESGYNTENLVKSGYASMMYLRCNDNVHQSIDCCPLMHRVMDTWPVQRLRDIKQLGTAYLVYPSGDHSRFEHSLGVAFLAREMCTRLQSKNPSSRVTNKDVLCVTLAGLCHDLGHGPFSHLYETLREEVHDELERDPSKQELYKRFPPVEKKWSHERSSLMMVDEVLRELGLCIDMREENLDKPLLQIGDGVTADSVCCFWSDSDEHNEVLTNRDWIFIKECIFGKPIPEVVERFGEERIGRTDPTQDWLYHIVSNSYNGIDVDKMDYFVRDRRRTLNDAGNVDISILNEACVALAECADPKCSRCKDGKYHYQICYPKKCVSRVIDFFKTRGKLHEFVYQHKTTCAAACMVKDIFKLADPYYLIPTEDPNVSLPISRAFSNPFAFERLRDSIIEDIARSTAPELQPAKELAVRYQRRKIYKLSSEKVLHVKRNRSHATIWKMAKTAPEDIVREICSVEPKHSDSGTGVVTELKDEDVIIVCSSWHQGHKDKNPMSFVRFVDKDMPSFARPSQTETVEVAKQITDDDYQMFTTREFQKHVIRAYCRDANKKDLLSHAFENFWERSVDGDSVSVGKQTPSVDFQTPHDSAGDDSDASDDEFHNGGSSAPAQLTQDSGDEGDVHTPIHSPVAKGLNLASPSPLQLR